MHKMPDNRKLSEADVVRMQELRNTEKLSFAKLGEMFGVGHATARRLCQYGYTPEGTASKQKYEDNRVRPVPSMTPWDEVAEKWTQKHPEEPLTGKQCEALFHKTLWKIRRMLEQVGIENEEQFIEGPEFISCDARKN
jgi:hypothetical protein